MIFHVYTITNAVDNKVYIGSTSNKRKRLSEHKRTLNLGTHKNRHLQSAWAYHGADAFSFDIIHEAKCLFDILALEKSEIFARESYNRERGYNISTNPDNSKLGVKLTAEQCAAVGKSKIGNRYRLGQSLDADARARISAKLKGRLLSAETRAKMSAARRGVPRTAECITKIHATRNASIAARRAAGLSPFKRKSDGVVP